MLTLVSKIDNARKKNELLTLDSKMDNARKKNVSIKKLTSRDIYGPLDSIECDDEGEIENLMNDSDTEFVAEDKTVVSIHGCVNEEKVGQISSISVPEASIHD